MRFWKSHQVLLNVCIVKVVLLVGCEGTKCARVGFIVGCQIQSSFVRSAGIVNGRKCKICIVVIFVVVVDVEFKEIVARQSIAFRDDIPRGMK